jgi:hypothetical protein
LAPEVLKKLENYESGRSHLLERIEELSQAIDRLTAENRSTREWFKTRLQLLWESTSRRDEAIGKAMKGILEHADEMSRQVGLREIGTKLEALLKVPADANPCQTLIPLIPLADPSTTRPTLPKTTPKPTTPTAAHVPEVEQSNKRPAEEEVNEGTKRRKLGGDD